MTAKMKMMMAKTKVRLPRSPTVLPMMDINRLSVGHDLASLKTRSCVIESIINQSISNESQKSIQLIASSNDKPRTLHNTGAEHTHKPQETDQHVDNRQTVVQKNIKEEHRRRTKKNDYRVGAMARKRSKPRDTPHPHMSSTTSLLDPRSTTRVGVVLQLVY